MKWDDKLIKTYLYLDKKKYFPLWELQKKWVQEIDQKKRAQTLMLLEHDHVYTLGRAAKDEHLLISKEMCREKGIEIAEIDRGGDITYHGPGQLVGYPLLSLNHINNNIHLYLRKLEETIIQTLAYFNIVAERKESYTGVWVKDEKIAAIGVKFNRGKISKNFITSHGFALNIYTTLSMFDMIVPCGIREYGVTSMEKIIGSGYTLGEVAEVYQSTFCQVFQLESM